MKKKWLSMLLSCALLASSVMPSFTAVAADRGGADAATAPTAAVEETAPAAEEAAPAAETAPVALEAADVPAATALAEDNTVTVGGKKYQITVVQDFDGDTTGVAAAGNGTVSIVDNAIGGTKSASYDGSAVTGLNKFSNLLFKTSATALQGDGLYVEVYTDDANGVGGNKNQQINLLGGNNHTTPLGRYGYSRDGAEPGFKVKGGESVTLEKPHVIMIPWSDFNNTNASEWDSSMDVATKNQSLSATNLLYVQITWNQTGGDSIKLDSGSKLYFDNIGFYSEYIEPEVPYSNTYTTWQNPLTTADVKIDTADAGRLSLSCESGKAKITRGNYTTGHWNNRVYFKLDPSKLTTDTFIDFDLTTSEDVPDVLALRFHLSSALNAGNEITSSEITNQSIRTGSNHSYHYHIPVSDFAFKDSNTLANANWLRVNFNSGDSVSYTILDDSFEYSNFKLLKGNDGTFEPGTEVVNVNPKVAEGGTLDVKVDADSNGGHAINWSELDHTANPSLQVKEGASVTLTAHPAEGMRTVWTGVPEQEEVRSDTVNFTATADSNPSATFEEIPKYTVTIEKAVYQQGEEDIPVPGASEKTTQAVTEGTELTLDVKPYEGFTFSNWRVNPVDHASQQVQEEKPYTYVITGEVTFTPVYTENMRIVKAVKDEEQGTTEDNVFWSASVGITAGYKVELKDAVDNVPAKLGYHFAGWEIVGDSSNATINDSGASITLNVPEVVIAPIYAENTPADVEQVEVRGAVSGPEGTTGNVEISVEGGERGTNTLAVASNKKVTLTAPDIAGKKFSHWLKGGADSHYIVSYEDVLEIFALSEGGSEALYTAVYVDAGDPPVDKQPTLNVYSSHIYGDKLVVVFEWRDADAVGMEIGDVQLVITGSSGETLNKELATYDIRFSNGYYTMTVNFKNGVPNDFTLKATLKASDDVAASTEAKVASATSLG